MSAVANIGTGGEVHVVHVRGELDVNTNGQLKAALAEAVAQAPNPVVVDLTAVEFIDSAALSLLLNTRRRLLRQGRGLAVAAGPGPVRRVFELTLLHETLGLCDSVQDAIRLATRPLPSPLVLERASLGAVRKRARQLRRI